MFAGVAQKVSSCLIQVSRADPPVPARGSGRADALLKDFPEQSLGEVHCARVGQATELRRRSGYTLLAADAGWSCLNTRNVSLESLLSTW